MKSCAREQLAKMILRTGQIQNWEHTFRVRGFRCGLHGITGGSLQMLTSEPHSQRLQVNWPGIRDWSTRVFKKSLPPSLCLPNGNPD